MIKLKLKVEKLERECLEKYSEIQLLNKTNNTLQKKLKNSAKIQRMDSLDIIAQVEVPAATSSLFPTNKTQQFKSSNFMKTAGHVTRVAAVTKYFEGDFLYQETPHTFITHNRWEYVIVCPNPDVDISRSSINYTDAKKLFRKSFKPEFSKIVSVLRENQQIENKAFDAIFNKLPGQTVTDKKFSNGGRFDMNYPPIVIDKKGPPQDFLTLMRNILLMKLGIHLGLHTKQIISSNGKYIYILVCADDQELENEAESINYDLQMEIGDIDLPSLEPCDANLRPFRLLKISSPLQQPIIDITNQLKNDFPNVMDLFKTTEADNNDYIPLGVENET